ncbi:MAG: T9SS type A sorting domain-containing protein [bacterium]|nr:T9SS type A sorting domain-containing protein [bacterium]
MYLRIAVSFLPAFLAIWLCGVAESTLAATWRVNSSQDAHDLIAGDGICGDPSSPDSTCTLRAALEESNSTLQADTIVVPFGYSPIRLRLDELVIGDRETLLRSEDGSTVIDGANQPLGSDLLIIRSRKNQVAGLTFRRARGNGIVIESDSNLIGGTGASDGNTVVGAGIDDRDAFGILISGAYNRASGNYVGMMPTGGVVIGNAHGIGVVGNAHHNLIGGSSPAERNIITGNSGNGISLLGGAHQNQVIGNFVGPDQSGITGPGNGGHGLYIGAGSSDNFIGGIGITNRNYLCGNLGDGVKIEGPDSEGNIVLGNSIGMDITGYVAMGNRGHGVSLTNGARRNQIGLTDSGSTNIISGNLGHGISITGAGSDENSIRGNLIGFDSSGFGPVGNGEYFGAGVYLGEGVARTVIGGALESERNYFAYNLLGGIYLDGSDDNVIQGNYVGVSLFNLSAGYNGNGIVLRNGASNNLIGGSSAGEGNTLSGNLMDEFPFGAGILMADPGTDRNRVFGNVIGLDATGSRRIPNASAGVVICEGASYNQIGGANAGEGNIISGNGYATNLVSIGRGVHLYGDGTAHNVISGNLIGLAGDSLSVTPNLGNGVGLYFGARDNVIGGTTESAGNLIAGNRSHGIYLQSGDTRRNLIRFNRIMGNDSLGIAIRQLAQDEIEPPLLVSYVAGEVTGMALPFATVDIYLAEDDASGAGEGSVWLASGAADANGEFAIAIDAQPADALVTAICTDLSGNSSAFSSNLSLDLITDVGEPEQLRPVRFALAQNYPNPFNPSTSITFTLPFPSRVRLSVYNILGEKVTDLLVATLPAGEHSRIWDGADQAGSPVASGVYWYRLEAGSFTATRKMLLLK